MATESSDSSQSGPRQPQITDTESTSATGESCENELETQSEHEQKTETSLSLDVVFDIVKNERRRLVLKYLADEEGPVSLGELAEHIAAIENDKDVKAINSSERKRVYVGLYQCHLPKMDAAGVIESERNSNIRLGENANAVMKYVDFEDDARPWHRYYLTLSTVGLFTVGVAAVSGAGAVSTALPGAVIVAMFGMATVHSSVRDT